MAMANFENVWHPKKLIKLIENIYGKLMRAVRIDKKLMEWFRMTIGVRQGFTLLPALFNLVLEAVMAVTLRDKMGGIMLCGRTVNNFRFANDTGLIALTKEDLQRTTDKIDQEIRKFRLKISMEKTKFMAIGRQEEEVKIKAEDKELEQVGEFVYFGGLVLKNGNCENDIKRRIRLATMAFKKTLQDLEV